MREFWEGFKRPWIDVARMNPMRAALTALRVLFSWGSHSAGMFFGVMSVYVAMAALMALLTVWAIA